MTSPPQKPLQELQVLSDSTTLYGDHKGQGIRVGVRSKDHSLYQAAAGGHLGEVKRLLESGFNPSDRTVCDWCPLVSPSPTIPRKNHLVIRRLTHRWKALGGTQWPCRWLWNCQVACWIRRRRKSGLRYRAYSSGLGAESKADWKCKVLGEKWSKDWSSGAKSEDGNVAWQWC